MGVLNGQSKSQIMTWKGNAAGHQTTILSDTLPSLAILSLACPSPVAMEAALLRDLRLPAPSSRLSCLPLVGGKVNRSPKGFKLAAHIDRGQQT